MPLIASWVCSDWFYLQCYFWENYVLRNFIQDVYNFIANCHAAPKPVSFCWFFFVVFFNKVSPFYCNINKPVDKETKVFRVLMLGRH